MASRRQEHQLVFDEGEDDESFYQSNLVTQRQFLSEITENEDIMTSSVQNREEETEDQSLESVAMEFQEGITDRNGDNNLG